jgi:alternate signal-mediated exported protein
MNKLVKGSIAGAAGIALLLGGAGTLATWNSSANVLSSGAAITAGTLDIKAHTFTSSETDTDGWKVNGTAKDLASFKIVPGDQLTYTKTFDVTATGDNLTATATLGTGAITAASAGPSVKNEDTALATALTNNATFAFKVDDDATSTILTTSQEIVVTVTINYKDNGVVAGVGAENGSKLGAVNLANFSINLTQTITS